MTLQQNGVKSSACLMQVALKTAYDVEISEQEVATITARLVSLIKLLDQMDEEQNEGVSVC
ncbi:hypothetical protein [Candidatus Avelusimicrobium faecicola]|uniref:hypothetical protein n=1 Tax=Candidatus Avelusimicrobium faecicola TaxID=3416205 RepID=UPI003D1049AB